MIRKVVGSFGLAIACTLGSARGADAPLVLHTDSEQRCGVMLGGVGTGYMELWPDGCFHDWAIFNRGHWGYRQDHWDQNKQDRLPLLEMNADAMQIFVWAKPAGGKPTMRRLSVNGEQTNVYSSNAWVQNVEGIRYDSTFPGATLNYEDSTLPVQVSCQFFSPVIPHELRTSGTPGIYAVFTLKNPGKEPVDVSLVDYLRNPLVRGGDGAHRGAAVRKLHNSVVTDKDTTYLTQHTDAADLPFKTTIGSMCLSVTGGEASWIASDFGEFLLGRTVSITAWNQRFETPFRAFRNSGKLPNTGDVPCPTQLGVLTVGGSKRPNTQDLPKDYVKNQREELNKLTDEQVQQIINQAKGIASLHSILDQAQAVDPDLLVPAKRGRDLVDILRQDVSQWAGEDGKAVNWGDSMLASSVNLKAGEEKQIRMTLSWFFPNHPSPKEERNMGHAYANWFKDAEDVNRFLTAHAEEFSTRVNTFRKILSQGNLPATLLASVSAQLNTLICSSWWTQDGKMGMWEGLGTIGQNTMDVSYQGSHPIVSLFPEWEKTWTKLATTYQSDKTGRLYHSLPGDMDKGPKENGYGYVDVNCHFAMEMARDYLWFGDKDYLDFYYPHLVKEIGVFEALDSDGDGLPDQHTNSNTYDTWDLAGTPSYMSSIWIGALRGGIRLAEDAGDTANVTKWKAMLEKATRSMDQKLWNGHYYSLYVDGDVRDDCCMIDQLSGEMYSKLIGLGNNLPVDHVRSAYASVFKFNFDPDQGLFNGAYPPGAKPRMPAFQNVQGEGNWTGIEYAGAAAMIDQGMVDEGMSVVDAVYRRYLRAGRFYNHEECGPHYYRPMSIWATLLAATGQKVDAPHQTLTFAPQIKAPTLTAPWVSATGLGQFTRTDSTFSMQCLDGDTSFKTLRVNVPGASKVTLAGKAVVSQASDVDGLSVIVFPDPIVLKPGDTLSIAKP